MSPDEIRPLFEYNAWANRRSLTAAEKLNVEQFTKPMGSSFRLYGTRSRTSMEQSGFGWSGFRDARHHRCQTSTYLRTSEVYVKPGRSKRNGC